MQQLFDNIMLPANFNILLEKGIPKGSNILLVGPPGIGKTIFCENVAGNCLENNMSCIYVTIDKTPDEIRDIFKKRGLILDESNIVFIDGYSWLIGKSTEAFHVESLSNLTELNFRIISAVSQISKPFLLIFDSISPLSLYNPENFVMKFLQLLLAKIKEGDGLGLYVVQAGVHSQEFYNTVGYLVDGIFDMKMIEAEQKINRYFRIRTISSVSHETMWMPFTIGDERAIKLLPEEAEKIVE